MRAREIRATVLAGCFAALMLLGATPASAQPAGMKFKVLLLWGTNDQKPPEGKHYKAAEAEVRDKLKDLPLKWAHWFEVSRKEFAVPKASAKRVPVSQKCEIEVKNLGDSNLEVAQFGKGKEVLRRKQSLEQGQLLILGGNAPNSTAWLIVLKRLE